VVAGLALAALTIGWPLSAAQSGRMYLRIGFRATALWGAALIVLGTLLLLFLGQYSSIYQVGATCFVIGAGMGLTASPTLVAAQSAVQWQQRGLVTGTNMFFRSTGSAVGVATFGAIANATLGVTIVRNGHVEAGALTLAVHHVFIATVLLANLLAIAVALMPPHKAE
jgi:MFS family permease